MILLRRVPPQPKGTPTYSPYPRGTWRLWTHNHERWVLATCPACGGDTSIRALHAPTTVCLEISDAGDVLPGFLCPHTSCGAALRVRLESWNPTEAGKPGEG